MNQKKLYILAICCMFFYSPNTFGMATKMYKPEIKIAEPKIINKKLGSFEASISSGYATNAFDNYGRNTNPMALFGKEALLTTLLPDEVLTHLPPQFINNLGQNSFNGKFSFTELILEGYQNIHNGFFIEGAAFIHDLRFTDISWSANFADHITNNQRKILEKNFTQALAQQEGFMRDGYLRKYGLLHSYALIGWGKHIQHLKHFDFIDITIKTGLNFPQFSDNYKSNIVFIPLDENYHLGIPITTNLACGFLDWLNIGWNSTIICWLPATGSFHMNPYPNDLATTMSTAQGMTLKKQGPFINTSLYIKADHVIKGFSAKLGWSYTHKKQSVYHPYDTNTFPPHIVNKSRLADGWKSSSIHLELEYDFATHQHPYRPTIGWKFSTPLSGEYIFATKAFEACSLKIMMNF